MAHIFLLEDDSILNKGIEIALKKNAYEVTTAFSYIEALSKYKASGYDLFLLDINLPDGNGMNFCRKIREMSDTPILFLTVNDTEQDMLSGFNAGCDDYITKPFSIEVLCRKIRAVLKRTQTGTQRFRYRDLEWDREKYRVMMKQEEIHLSATEYKLLCYLMEHRGMVVTKEALLENVWDVDGSFIDENSIRVHILRLRQKLHDDKQEYISTVFGIGYIFGD